ncbi:MAG: hypothetical protein V4616_06650 [Bacteroidota bacterium]
MIGNENHRITLAEAAELTANFRNAPLAIVAAVLTGLKGEALGKNDIDTLLQQPGCTGTRIYFGLQLLPIPKFRLILVGVDANDNDLVNGILLDHGKLCPPACGISNVLNS